MGWAGPQPLSAYSSNVNEARPNSGPRRCHLSSSRLMLRLFLLPAESVSVQSTFFVSANSPPRSPGRTRSGRLACRPPVLRPRTGPPPLSHKRRTLVLPPLASLLFSLSPPSPPLPAAFPRPSFLTDSPHVFVEGCSRRRAGRDGLVGLGPRHGHVRVGQRQGHGYRWRRCHRPVQCVPPLASTDLSALHPS